MNVFPKIFLLLLIVSFLSYHFNAFAIKEGDFFKDPRLGSFPENLRAQSFSNNNQLNLEKEDVLKEGSQKDRKVAVSEERKENASPKNFLMISVLSLIVFIIFFFLLIILFIF